MARLIVDQGWPIPRAAERYDVSWRTAKKWADRYRAAARPGVTQITPLVACRFGFPHVCITTDLPVNVRTATHA